VVVGAVAELASFTRLIGRTRIDIALIDALSPDQLIHWSRRHRETAFVAIVDEPPEGGEPDAADTLRAGARGLLSRTAPDAEVAITVQAAAKGLCVLPSAILRAWQERAPALEGVPPRDAAAATLLTPRELEVLGAMADGASNKAIARRLGISFHTAKFHVAGILAKLDADSRTEAVTKAAQLGLVML
jgi:DNA-binding NarL/FixJ family response regulator